MTCGPESRRWLGGSEERPGGWGQLYWLQAEGRAGPGPEGPSLHIPGAERPGWQGRGGDKNVREAKCSRPQRSRFDSKFSGTQWKVLDRCVHVYVRDLMLLKPTVKTI